MEINTENQIGTPETDPSRIFTKCRDARGHEILGLWQRNGRFYYQMNIPGKGTRRVPLYTESNAPVETVSEAVRAKARLLLNREEGKLPGPRITPKFAEYWPTYIKWLEDTKAKSPLTIKKERYALAGWSDFFGDLRLNQILQRDVKAYAQRRVTEDGVSNRAANLDVIALSHLLHFAKEDGWLKGSLPTEGWKALGYKAPKRTLFTLDQINAICTEATASVKDEKGAQVPKYENGQFISDLVRLAAFSGARRQAALSACWDQVDFENRQLTLFTKFDKRVVVDFNEPLEAHLKDMQQRRGDSKFLFPAVRDGKRHHLGYFSNPQKSFSAITKAAGVPGIRLHDLRHFFLSYCVMSGVDILTVATWAGHADGGKLIGTTYGHLDPKHRRASASKVRFAVDQKPDELELTTDQLLAMLQKKLAAGAPQPENRAEQIQTPEAASAS